LEVGGVTSLHVKFDDGTHDLIASNG
jgi:hypothetical protein